MPTRFSLEPVSASFSAIILIKTAPIPFLSLGMLLNWVTRARVKNVASRIRDGMEYLFDPEKPFFSAWVKLYNIDHRPWPHDLQTKMQPGAAPLCHAAFCGFHKIVEHLALKYPWYAMWLRGDCITLGIACRSRPGCTFTAQVWCGCGCLGHREPVATAICIVQRTP